ncbi:hypothetical protein FSARC_7983 [Fusarium sarcochroum]|uniref:NmrA-like domain-containing protein n=1 Tax=Fusarium sarcochroum TaxID=1208366 RepID=A0A8H4X7Q7_9HYPO|nr:hypothetical protein FSARC_7983 [Fusarium sarcochroum]
MVFVCGATGTQGGALSRYLISKGVIVHSLTRNLSSTKAKEAAALGVKFWPGDFDDEDALKSAIQETYSIFLNLSPSFTDIGANLRQAKLILRVALAAGAKQVIYTSGLSVREPERVGNWDPQFPIAQFLEAKADIEETIRNAKKDTFLPLVSPKTIGSFGGAAVLDPPAFHTKQIEFADELLTPEDIVRKLSVASGKSLEAKYQSDKDIERTKMQNPHVPHYGVPLSSFDEFVEEHKLAILETFSQVS